MIIPVAICLLFLAFSSCYTYVDSQTMGTSTSARSVTVEALDDEISYNLDLRAVATLFADSRNLEDFEHMLNEYDRGISNLDLNQDGYVDYLRVVEMYEKGTHLILLQAVLDYNVFQDVATIVVEGRNQNNVSVQIIGDPFIYGSAYIINPVFYRSPIIYSSLWSSNYMAWSSPYYWGNYPTYYHYRAPERTNIYVNNVYVNVNTNNNYRYANTVKNQRTVARMQANVSRNDYARANPGQSFSSRNTNVNNAREIQTRNRSTQATTNSSRSSSPSSTRNSDNATNNSSSSRSSSSGTVNSNTNNSSSSRSNSSGTVNSNTNNSSSSRSNSSGTVNSNTNNSSSGRSSSSGTVNSNTNNSSSRRSNSSGTVNSNTNNSSSSRSSSSGTNSRSSSGRR